MTSVVEAGVVKIKTYTNGQNANYPPGPFIIEGSEVSWEYLVKNQSDSPLYDIQVTDSQIGDIDCPDTMLNARASMKCIAKGVAILGLYSNIGSVTAKFGKGLCDSDDDPSHYTGIRPSIDIEKLVEGEDADTPTGPILPVGATVQFTYIVTNTGSIALSNVIVTDSKGLVVTCPKTTLLPLESMTCTASEVAVAGQHVNIGTVVGTPPIGPVVNDTDPANYYAEQTTNEGCTPGYWKNHTDSWAATGYSPAQTVLSVFSSSSSFSTLASSSLLSALSFAGGPGVSGAAEILLRAAVAALLNSAHPDVDYPRTTASIIADVNAALASNDRDVMLALAAALDADNNLGCPLS